MLNEKYIELYYDTVFSYCEGLIPLRSFSEKDTAEIVFPLWIEAKKDTALGAIKTFGTYTDRKRASALCIPGTVKESGQAKACDIREMQVLAVDIDNGNIEAKLTHARNYLGIPTLIVESGGVHEGQNKLHIYWKLNEVAMGDDLANLIEMRRKLALKIGGDVHFASAHQPIRIAGTIYHKLDEPKLVNIREHNSLEYSLYDLEENVIYMPGLTGIDLGVIRLDSHVSNKMQAGDLFKQAVRAGNLDSVSRFSAISSVIGYCLRRVRENHMTLEEAINDIHIYNELKISPMWERSRVDREIQRLLQRDIEKYGEFALPVIVDPKDPPKRNLVNYTLEILHKKLLKEPTFYLKHGLLPARSFMLLAGPPKIGKSNFILNLLARMSAGEPYLEDFVPTKPLKIFYLQNEVDAYTLQSRAEIIKVDAPNLVITAMNEDENTMNEDETVVFNDKGMQEIYELIKEAFPDTPPDVICIDPLRNMFYSDGKGGTSSEEGMTEFCRRLRILRNKVNPQASIMLIHHTKKISGNMLNEDLFNMISGSGALRGIYDTGIVFFREDEKYPDNVTIKFEIRKSLPGDKIIERINLLRKNWEFVRGAAEANTATPPTSHKELELQEKIIELIKQEAKEGRIYTVNGFADAFAKKEKLPSFATLERKLNGLAERQDIQFFDNPEDYGAVIEKKNNKKANFLCIPSMELKVKDEYKKIKASHYRCPVQLKILAKIEIA